MRLYWTPSRTFRGQGSEYQPQETLKLPVEFWDDLKQILGLLTRTAWPNSFWSARPLRSRSTRTLDCAGRALVASKEGSGPRNSAGCSSSRCCASHLPSSPENEPLAESTELIAKYWTNGPRAVPLTGHDSEHLAILSGCSARGRRTETLTKRLTPFARR